MPGRGACRNGCGATIRWLLLNTGKHIAVNPVPDPAGNVAAKRWTDGNYHEGYVTSKASPLKPGFVLFMPHAADCSDPSERKPMPSDLAARAKPAPAADPDPLF